MQERVDRAWNVNRGESAIRFQDNPMRGTFVIGEVADDRAR